jgi:hypothetical protein
MLRGSFKKCYKVANPEVGARNSFLTLERGERFAVISMLFPLGGIHISQICLCDFDEHLLNTENYYHRYITNHSTDVTLYTLRSNFCKPFIT